MVLPVSILIKTSILTRILLNFLVFESRLNNFSKIRLFRKFDCLLFSALEVLSFFFVNKLNKSQNFVHLIKFIIILSRKKHSRTRPIFVNQQGVQVYKESGYKTLRLVTEMLPATLAISSRIEPVWGVIVFATLFFFGLAQLGIMWKPISGAIGTSTSAVLLSCITGLFLGFPLTTDNGIVIIHFLDFIFGGAWWLLILWTSYIVAIFMVRGQPFTSDVLVKELRLTETLSAFLAFSWNVLLSVALVLLSVMEYKKKSFE